jgi:hypothetical protein
MPRIVFQLRSRKKDSKFMMDENYDDDDDDDDNDDDNNRYRYKL